MQECENQKRITAVAIGDFDGMHRAHNIVCTGAEQVIIYCVHNRFSLLQKSIFQRRYPTAVFADFNAIRNMEGRQFVEDVLIGRFGAGMVLCGFNFRFGKNAAWDAMRLRAYLEDRGIWVRILEHQDYQGAPISSTRIRAAVQAGEMEQAAAMLGYNFTFENPVLHGDARGRTIGYPTINQQYPDGLVLPKFGVYESRILVGDTWYRGFTNIGVRPTWQVETPLAETHILTTTATCTVKRCRWSWCVICARNRSFLPSGRCGSNWIMIKAVFFDFDETLQDRTAAFERYMDGFFARFFPGVTGGELEEKKHQMRQSGNGGYVDRVEWYKGLIALWHWTDAPAAEALAEHYDRTFGDCCVIFPDAVPMLQALRKKGIVTGVITNGPSYLQNHKMDESGLRPYLDLVIVSGDVGVHKPDPALFLYACDKVQLLPADCMYVGDHPVNDIAGALSAGMQAVRMNWGWFKDQDLRADVPVIGRVSDVLQYV